MSATARCLRDYLLYLSILSLTLITFPIGATTTSSDAQAGYAFKNEEWAAPPLTAGNITVPKMEEIYEGYDCIAFMAIVLDYANYYYVLCGYEAYGIDWNEYTWYFIAICNDAISFRRVRWGFAIDPFATYRYTVCHIYRSNDYQVLVEAGVNTLVNYRFNDLSPYIQVDHQAMVRINAPVKTGLIHFEDLTYRGYRGYAHNWYTHIKVPYPGFVIDKRGGL